MPDDDKVLLQVVIRGGLPHIEFAPDEVLARYAVDKARATIDQEFMKRDALARLQGITIAQPDNGQIRRLHG